MPLLESLLPSEISDELKQVTQVHHGRHFTAFLTLKNNQQLFVKMLKKGSIEGEVLAELNRLVEPNSAAQLPWSQSVYYDPHILVTSKVSGEHFNKQDLLQFVDKFCQCLHQVHSTSLVKLELTNVVLPERLDIKACDDIYMQSKLTSAISQIRGNNCYSALLHGDLSQFNIIKTGKKQDSDFVFIDWEFTQFGDCRWDLAAIAVEFSFSQDEFTQLCQIYQREAGIEDANFFAIAQAWLWVYAVTCINWGVQHNQPYQQYILYIQGLN